MIRDVIPAVRSTSFVIEVKAPSNKKMKVLRKAILQCKKEESKKEKEEKEKQRKEAELRGISSKFHFKSHKGCAQSSLTTLKKGFFEDEMHEKDEYYEEKTIEAEKRLEALNRNKHKLFLILKQVLQNEKKKMQAIATKKAEEVTQFLLFVSLSNTFTSIHIVTPNQ